MSGVSDDEEPKHHGDRGGIPVDFLADEVLWCALCGGRPKGVPSAAGWYPDPGRAVYRCTSCRNVEASVVAVHRELQELTLERLSHPAYVARWRERRLTALEAELVEQRAVLAYGRAEARIDGSGSRRLRVFIKRRAAMRQLGRVADRLVDIVEEHAALREGTEGDARDIRQLRNAQAQVLSAGRQSPVDWEELHRLSLSFWDLLQRPDWHNPEPARLPAQHEALAEDWSLTPTREAGLRRRLLLRALGGDWLVLKPGPRVNGVASSRVRVVPRTP